MQIRIYHDQSLLYSGTVEGPFELGRQRSGEPLPYAQIPYEGGTRIIIAALQEQAVSRRQLMIEPVGLDQANVNNLSNTLTIKAEGKINIPPGSSANVPLPLLLTVGRRMIRLSPDENEQGVHSLSTRTRLPSRQASMDSLSATRSALLEQDETQWNKVVDWLRSAMDVLQGAATSDVFFQTACDAAIGMVGLDSARVLLAGKADWEVQAVASADNAGSVDWRASRSVLNRVKKECRTFWKSSVDLGSQASSLTGLTSVVAAPILDEKGEVIAALYGDRRFSTVVAQQAGLKEIDAVLMELLACGIASGLARVEQERAALTAQARFEEFFTPRLSKRLMNDPSLLQGQDCEVTLFFCDIRGFSRVTERLGPQVTVRWLNDVMGLISEAVLDRDGVLVDYNGDEAMAMWGAPETQPDQAQRACDAGLTILERLPELNRRWYETLGENIEVGIGINTGSAFVGNIGSHRKFKYGPLGNVVNQASRIQGATKYFHCTQLVAETTLKQLDPKFVRAQSRRICRVKVVNIEQAVELYEIVPTTEPDFAQRKELFEAALTLLDDDKYAAALEKLTELRTRFPEDKPAAALCEQMKAIDEEDSMSMSGSGLWVLPGK